jgi:hypothetical protein
LAKKDSTSLPQVPRKACGSLATKVRTPVSVVRANVGQRHHRRGEQRGRLPDDEADAAQGERSEQRQQQERP